MAKKTPEEKAKIERKRRENVSKKLAKKKMPKSLISKEDKTKPIIKRNPLFKKPTKKEPKPTFEKTGSIIPKGKPLIPKGKNLLQILAQPTEEEITELIEHRKQVRRIRNFIRRAQARGYEFFETPDFDNLSSEDLKNIKSNDLYQYANFHDEQSGETFTGEQGRRIEKYRQTLKARQAKLEKEKAEQEEYERIRKEYEKLEQEQQELQSKDLDNIQNEIDNDVNEDKWGYDSDDYDYTEEQYLTPNTTSLGKQNYLDSRQSLAERLAEFDEENYQYKNSFETPIYKNIFEIIDAILNSIPDYVFISYDVKYNTAQLRNEAKSIWENTVAQAEENLQSTGEAGIINYLENEQVAEKLEYNVNLIRYKASAQEDIEQCWNEILEILNGGLALTQEQQKEFEILNEIY